jgi:[ribosomal protein S5]-alanine N-acetyltransferase
MTPLETERLILREFTESDVEAFYELGNNPVVTRFTGDPGFTSLDAALASLRERPLADYQKHGFGRWAVVLKSSRQVIGFTGLKYLDDLQAVDIGYRLLPEHWGKGLATESSRPAIRYGFETLHLNEIIGLVDPANVASVHVLEKLGLTYAGMTEYRHGPALKYAIDAGGYSLLTLERS